jgi:hypothetical protein
MQDAAGKRHDMVARIEAAEADAFLRLYQAAADQCGTLWHTVDGVSAVWSPRDDDPGYSCVLNLADAESPVTTLERLERAAQARGVPLQGIDGSPAVLERISDADLRGLGYVAEYEECMWGREVSPQSVPDDPLPPGLAIERVDSTQRETFARVLNVGYDLPDAAVRGYIFASTIELTGWYHYLATFEGEPGAASVLYVTEGVADLFVATTMPHFRGRGAQGALIRQRLRDGLAAGCDIATSQTVVDNASPRNMARHGFGPLYNRWIYGKVL